MPTSSQAMVVQNNLIGSAVHVFFDPYEAPLDPDYIDYGCPHYAAYDSEGPSFIFMGVDFTVPFDVDNFPFRNLPYKRLYHLRRYLQRIKDPPGHLWSLMHLIHREERKSAGLQRTREDQRVTHMLPSTMRTMTGDIVLYLFQAPLASVHPTDYDASQTLDRLRQYGWDSQTWIRTAASICAHTPPLRPEFTFNPHMWRWIRNHYEDVPDSVTYTTKGSIPAGRTTWLPVGTFHLYPDSSLTNFPSARTAQFWAVCFANRSVEQGFVPGLRVVEAPVVGRLTVPDCLPPLSKQEKINVKKSWWTQVYPATGEFLDIVHRGFLPHTQGLPLDIVFHVLRMACTNQAAYLQLCSVARGVSTLLGTSIPDKIGPIFFEPAWAATGVGQARALVRVGDWNKSNDTHPLTAADVCHSHASRYSVLPAVQTVSTAIATKHWPRGRWPTATEVSLDLVRKRTAAGPLSATGWDANHLSTADIAFLVHSFTLLGRITSLRDLQRLDLRLGDWALYADLSGYRYALDAQRLYARIATLSKLEYISISLQARSWITTPLLVDIDLQQLLFGPPPSNGPGQRSRLKYVRVLLPNARLTFDTEKLLPMLGQLVHFEVVVDSFVSDVTPAELAFLVCQHAPDTLQHVRVVCLGDERTLKPLTYALRPRIGSTIGAFKRPVGPGRTGDIHLLALTTLHIESYIIPYNLLEQLRFKHNADFTTIILRSQLHLEQPEGTLFRDIVPGRLYGSIGPFYQARDAIEFYLTVCREPKSLLKKDIYLTNRKNKPFSIGPKEISTVTCSMTREGSPAGSQSHPSPPKRLRT